MDFEKMERARCGAPPPQKKLTSSTRARMEEQRRIFQTFLTMNAARATATEEPAVHMMFSTDNINGALYRLSREDVLHECAEGRLDRDSELVRWMLHQMTTYDCRTQRILALRFDRATVLSEVLRCR